MNEMEPWFQFPMQSLSQQNIFSPGLTLLEFEWEQNKSSIKFEIQWESHWLNGCRVPVPSTVIITTESCWPVLRWSWWRWFLSHHWFILLACVDCEICLGNEELNFSVLLEWFVIGYWSRRPLFDEGEFIDWFTAGVLLIDFCGDIGRWGSWLIEADWHIYALVD